MTECTTPEDLIEVLTTLWPTMPAAGWIILGLGALMLLAEFMLRFNYGGIPDGFLGGLGLIGLGIAAIAWAQSWPASCGGSVMLVAICLVGAGALLSVLVILFWRARTRDGGTLVRTYGTDTQAGAPQGGDWR